MLIFKEDRQRNNGKLNENSFDRKVNNYIKDYTGLEDFNQVRSFLLNKVYKTIPELRLITRPEAVHSALEWFFNPDGSPKNEDYIAPFRQILQAIKEKAPDELNKMGYVMQFMEPQSYCKEYGYLLKHEQNTVSSSNSQKERTTPNGYHIRRIDSFDEAYGGGMSEWCIGRDAEWWDEMVGYTATVYLVWNKDVNMDYEETYGSFTDEDGGEFESTYDEYFMDMSYTDALRDPNYGSFGSGKYPYDRYGLSKLVVIAHDSGMFEVWSRYNLTDGKDGTFLSEKQLSKLIGMNARQAFPYVDFNIKETKNNKTRMKAIRLTESQLRRYIKEAIDSYSGKEAFTEGFYACADTDYAGGGNVNYWVTDNPEEAYQANLSSNGWAQGPFDTQQEAESYISKMRDDKPTQTKEIEAGTFGINALDVLIDFDEMVDSYIEPTQEQLKKIAEAIGVVKYYLNLSISRYKTFMRRGYGRRY